MVSGVTTNKWLDLARGLEPTIEKWRDVGEQERHLPESVFTAMRAAGIFRLLVPTAFGGEGADLETAYEVIEEISRQDGAAGWNVMIGVTYGPFAECLSEAVAREIFGKDPDTPLAGTFAPIGRATPVEGGYRLSGRWPFASGCQHVNWMVAGGVVEDGSSNSEPGSAQRRFFIVPARECEIIDTWHTSGLRGTGSHDFKVSDAFVPEERSIVVIPRGVSGTSGPGTVVLRSFLAQAAPLMAGVGLGIARDAIDSFKALAGAKTPTGGRTTLIAQQSIQERVGRAEARVRSARSFLLESLRGVSLAAQTSPDISEELETPARLAAANAAESAAEVASMMYTAGGGSSVYATSRLERCFRDAHTVNHHVTVAPSNFETAGQYFLGLGGAQQKR